ncbi:MAG TPA: biotin--[acetyl-CoA-carboxylase] ligase [Desulfobulbus sp.]|nr:biotin--[acetyl-CoA-carboxylase] ligase [Desulfobulbus sp.]
MLSHSSICRLARESSQTTVYGTETIERILRYGAPMGCRVEHHPRLSRCMDRLRSLVDQQSANSSIATGTVVRADELSNSSGRFDRRWHAPSGGLYLALLWADTFLPEFSRLLPFATGIACCETVNAFGVNAGLKWVNDVHVQGEKVAGILSEMLIGPDDERFHLIGIGINANNTIFPEELQAKATGLRLLTGQQVDLDELCRLLLARLQWNFGLLCYVEEQGLAGIQDQGGQGKNLLLQRFLELSDTPGKMVQYGYDVQKKPLYRAVARDIDPEGGLIMELEDGTLVTEYSGEILYLDGE